jgi:hypothetical protein
MPLPTPSEPVNEMADLRMRDERRADARSRSGDEIQDTLGMPACSRIFTSSSDVSGACEAGLNTTALPETSAGAIFQVGMAMGKFHGAIRATTPERLPDQR